MRDEERPWAPKAPMNPGLEEGEVGSSVNVRQLRVLVVINDLGFGGTERMLERLAIRLTDLGRVRFTVCSLGSVGPIGRRLQARNIEVIALGARGGALNAVLRGALAVRRLLRERRYDLVHSFLYRSHCAARLAKLSLGLRIRLISSERCLGENRSRLLLLLNRAMSRWSDRILAVSEAVKDRTVLRDRVPSKKIQVVRNGILEVHPRASAGARLRRILGISPAEVVFLQLGRLHREKGPDVLLQALGRLNGNGAPPWRAILVGSGPEREALVRAAAAMGIGSHVLFVGARGYVEPWIEACDLLVLPSREEGLPVSALEAMARGKPVVASRVGGTPEVVGDHDNGLLVPPEDPAALAAALLTLAGDAEKRKEMGRRGMLRVRAEFSLDRMAEEIMRCYETLVGGFERQTANPVSAPALRVLSE